MKYRRLRADELEELQPEFVRFLAANQVTADDWEKLKADDAGKAEQLIVLFSDIVFDKVLGGVEYLEYKAPQDLKTFRFLEDKAVMNGLRIEGETSMDLTHSQSAEQLMQQLQLSGASLKLYSAEKKYTKTKEMEAFQLMEAGALISKDGALYKALESLKK